MENKIDTPKKRGRKPLGERAMTPAEAKRRSREKMRSAGAKDFLMTVGPAHLIWVKHLAEQLGISEAAALHHVVDNALDYFGSFMRFRSLMKVAGASREECNEFEDRCWPLRPPEVPEILARLIDLE